MFVNHHPGLSSRLRFVIPAPFFCHPGPRAGIQKLCNTKHKQTPEGVILEAQPPACHPGANLVDRQKQQKGVQNVYGRRRWYTARMKIIDKTLKNGLRVILIPKQEATTVTMMTFTGVGSQDEGDDEKGIAHFLEHMMFKGTSTHNNIELIRALENMGAETNAYTTYDHTAYYIKVAHSKWKQAFRFLSDISHDSQFPTEELEKEKGVVLGEISMYEDDNERKAYRSLIDQVYMGTELGSPVLGNRKSIKAMTREKLVAFYEKHYIPTNSVLVLSGKLPKDAISVVKQRFGDEGKQGKKIKRPKVKAGKKTGHFQHIKRKTDQTHLVMGIRTFGRDHKDNDTLTVLSTILGSGMSSRLFEKLREEMGVGYYVGSQVLRFSHTGLLIIRAGVDTRRRQESLAAIKEQLQRFIDESVSEQELKKAKNFLVGMTNMRLETTDAWAEYFGTRTLLYGSPMKLSERLRAIKAVTAKDIRRVAKKILQKDNIYLTSLGSQPVLDK